MRPVVLALPFAFAAAMAQASGPTPASANSVLPDPVPAATAPRAAVPATTFAVAEREAVLTALPAPDVPPGSKPSEYLRAAQSALATGDVGRAQEALEMAQTRMLDRSVPLYQTNTPSDNPATTAIGQARHALAQHDRSACMQAIQAALAATTAQGL